MNNLQRKLIKQQTCDFRYDTTQRKDYNYGLKQYVITLPFVAELLKRTNNERIQIDFISEQQT